MRHTTGYTPYFPNVTVHTERGDLTGTLVGQDGELVRVCIPTATAPAWFKDAHKSPCPQFWASASDVERED